MRLQSLSALTKYALAPIHSIYRKEIEVNPESTTSLIAVLIVLVFALREVYKRSEVENKLEEHKAAIDKMVEEVNQERNGRCDLASEHTELEELVEELRAKIAQDALVFERQKVLSTKSLKMSADLLEVIFERDSLKENLDKANATIRAANARISELKEVVAKSDANFYNLLGKYNKKGNGEFNFFNNCTDTKRRYKLLSAAYHPDKGGDSETMKNINDQYNKL